MIDLDRGRIRLLESDPPARVRVIEHTLDHDTPVRPITLIAWREIMRPTTR